MLLNVVVDMKLFNVMLVRRTTTSEQGNIHVFTWNLLLCMLKGGERDGGQTGIGGPSSLFVEGGVGCWSPFVKGDGG